MHKNPKKAPCCDCQYFVAINYFIDNALQLYNHFSGDRAKQLRYVDGGNQRESCASYERICGIATQRPGQVSVWLSGI